MILQSRKGVVFTIMAIVIAAVIIAGAAVLSPVQVEQESAELFRVGIVSNIVLSFDQYAITSLRTATRSSLDNVTDFLVTEDGDFSDPELTIFFDSHAEFQDAVATCFVGGAKSEIELSGETPASSSPLHCNSQNFTVLLREYQELVADAYNVEITGFESIDKSSFHITQSTPFRVRVNFTLPEITVFDPASGAQWILPEKNLSTTVPIDGLKDPLVEKMVQANAASDGFSRTIRPFTNFAGSFSVPVGAEEVYSVLQNEQYFSWMRAPSFLERFYMHNAGPSEAGIASFVNGTYLDNDLWPETIADGLTSASNYSHIDFDILYGGTGTFSPKTYACSGDDFLVSAIKFNDSANTKDYFWLNSSAMARFGVNGSNQTGC